MGSDYLVCWETLEGNKQWYFCNHKDRDRLFLSLLEDNNVLQHSIFVIPTSSIMGAIWLNSSSHKNSRVDFFDFEKDYGETFEPIVNSIELNNLAIQLEENRKIESKFGYIAPNGTYYHCDFQGHSALADRICFGFVDTNNSENYLETHGWLKIYSSNGKPNSNYGVYVGGKYTITKEQFSTLEKMELLDADNISEMLVKD